MGKQYSKRQWQLTVHNSLKYESLDSGAVINPKQDKLRKKTNFLYTTGYSYGQEKLKT